MQWSPDRNAGFSTADPGKLYLPVIDSLQFNRQAVNVEAAMASPSSLLHWLRGILAVRKDHPVFGRGAFATCQADSPAVLAFVRSEVDGEVVLCVNNLSPSPVSVTLTLPDPLAGASSSDLVGGAAFPAVGDDGRLTLTLAGRGFYWLLLEST